MIQQGNIQVVWPNNTLSVHTAETAVTRESWKLVKEMFVAGDIAGARYFEGISLVESIGRTKIAIH